jgi:DNA polymerase-3 subunit chi
VLTQLEFHTGIADPLGYSCRLLRKAYRRGSKVVVCGQSERLLRLDTMLWTFEQLEFVPHARLGAGEQASEVMQRTPIWLVDRRARWPQADVVVNLGDEAVDEPQRFARLIEIVGEEPDQAQAGRARWRHYASLGLTPMLVGAKADAGQASEEGTAAS